METVLVDVKVQLLVVVKVDSSVETWGIPMALKKVGK
jgi:hypothetical protein